MNTPDKAVPGGCVVVLFGIFSWAYTGLCVYLLANRELVQDPFERSELVEKFSIHGAISFLLGILLIYFGSHLASRADMSDPLQGPMIR